MEKNLTMGVLLLGMCVMNAFVASAAEPTIIIGPESPAPASEVTFSAEISDDNVSEVWLIVTECKGSTFCYMPQNVSMSESEVENNTYEVDVMLEYDDSTYITYEVNVKSDGGWEKSEDHTVYLSVPSNGDQSSNGDDTNQTPGFELIPMMLSIAIIVFIFKRKRDR